MTCAIAKTTATYVIISTQHFGSNRDGTTRAINRILGTSVSNWVHDIPTQTLLIGGGADGTYLRGTSPNTVNSATPGVIPAGAPRITRRALVAPVAANSR